MSSRRRAEYHLTWNIEGTTFAKAMPDELVTELQLDPHSAVVAVTHDPKLDDMALLEALAEIAGTSPTADVVGLEDGGVGFHRCGLQDGPAGSGEAWLGLRRV